MRIHVIYSGRVQGIGFRYTTQGIAHQVGVTGWVRNRSDGTVELIAEGPDQSLRSFLKGVEDAFSSSIRDSEVSWSEARGEFADFSIEF